MKSCCQLNRMRYNSEVFKHLMVCVSACSFPKTQRCGTIQEKPQALLLHPTFCSVGSLANPSSTRKFLLKVSNYCLNQVYSSLQPLMFLGLNILSFKVYLLSEIYFSLSFPAFIVESIYKIYRLDFFFLSQFFSPQKIQVIKSLATEAKSFLFLIQHLKQCSSSLQTVGVSFLSLIHVALKILKCL